ncbi:uncharacterized protein LOC110861699 [Folsomia candida]|uniref:Apolipoprotein L4 n=1 Tax=Folsomia candida TaxID=158441 RepID=A0A226EWL7_FOLCA|nr:uncharacterized protein LOC110861699 [Folsomia candida]XP_035702041.1 uncharacterized protein LOC110861699 [Folsomia candida]OXA61547.1 Apolipoprotein L4 [Folsomia candida]
MQSENAQQTKSTKLYPEIGPPPANIYPNLNPDDPLQNIPTQPPISMEQCISDLIVSETELLVKLTEICVILRQRHKNCAISKTAGSSASIVGSVLTISGVFLAPFTAGLSLTATAAGIATTVAGVGTTIGTDITKSFLHKKTIKELEALLEIRLKQYEFTGKQISKALDVASMGVSATANAAQVLSFAKIYQFLYINRDIYGITGLTASMCAQEQLGGLLVGVVRPQLNKGLALIGLKLGARTFMVGLGVIFIALDIKTIVDCWRKEPKLCGQVEEICKDIQAKIDSHEKLLTDKDDNEIVNRED